MSREIRDLLEAVGRALAIEDGQLLGDPQLVRQFWRWLNTHQTVGPPPAERPVLFTPWEGIQDEYQWWDMGAVIYGDHRSSRTVWRIPRAALADMPHIPAAAEIAYMNKETRDTAVQQEAPQERPEAAKRHLHIVGPDEG